MENDISYIAFKDLEIIMAKRVLFKFNEFLDGQTTLELKDGDYGVYIWDLQRFIDAYKRSKF